MKAMRAWMVGIVMSLFGAGNGAWAMSPEEYSELAPEVALQVPMVEALSVFGWTKKEYYFIVENALMDLRYHYRAPLGTSSQALSDSVRAFQKSLLNSPSGNLRVSEFVELISRTNAYWQVPILPGPDLIWAEGDLVNAEGTWSNDRIQDPDPIQKSVIRCRKSTGACTMSTARVRMNADDDSWFHANSAELSVQIMELKVTRWEAQRVEAQYAPAFCITDTLVIDLRAEEVRNFRTRATASECANVAISSETFKLSNGDDIALKYWERRRERANLLRSKSFQKLVSEIQAGRAAR